MRCGQCGHEAVHHRNNGCRHHRGCGCEETCDVPIKLYIRRSQGGKYHVYALSAEEDLTIDDTRGRGLYTEKTVKPLCSRSGTQRVFPFKGFDAHPDHKYCGDCRRFAERMRYLDEQGVLEVVNL